MITHERMLIWKVVREDGNLDEKKIAFYYQDVEEAISEAEAYSKKTREASDCLKRLLR